MAKLWAQTTIGHALVVAAGLGVAFYVSVGLAYATSRRILAQPSTESASDRDSSSPEETSSEEKVTEGAAPA